MAVDGMAAARTLLSFARVTPGYCLKYVWQAYQAHGAVSDGKGYPTAKSAWDKTAPQFRHPGDRNPPPGVPVYWGAKPSSAAGDIVISMGGGIVACTDWPRAGVTGTTTLSQREAQIQRPYLGWTETILGYPVKLGGSGGGSLPFPTPDEQQTRDEDSMFYLRVDDDGNGRPFFTVHDTQTNVYRPPIYGNAPAWMTKTLGEPVSITRADWLDMGRTIQALTSNVPFQGTMPA